MKLKLLSIIVGIVVTTTGLYADSNPIDQSKMCTYSTDKEAKKCKSGELAWFSPSQWGNEQLPLSVAAAYCDFNYEIMYNKSGVICVFTDKRIKK